MYLYIHQSNILKIIIHIKIIIKVINNLLH